MLKRKVNDWFSGELALACKCSFTCASAISSDEKAITESWKLRADRVLNDFYERCLFGTRENTTNRNYYPLAILFPMKLDPKNWETNFDNRVDGNSNATLEVAANFTEVEEIRNLNNFLYAFFVKYF